MATLGRRATSVITTNGTTWASTTNCVDGSYGAATGTYGTWTNNTRNSTGYIELGGFDFSTIPAGSTINSVTVYFRHYETHTGAPLDTALCAVSQWDGATQIGTDQAISLTTTAGTTQTFTGFTAPSLAQLQSTTYEFRVFYDRTNSSTQSISRIDHIDVLVDYTAPVTTHSGIAAFTSETSLTAVGSVTSKGVAAFTSETSLTAVGTVITGSVTHNGVAAFSSESSLTAVGRVEFEEIESFIGGTENGSYGVTSGISDTGSGTGFVYTTAARVTTLRGCRVTFEGTLQVRRFVIGGTPTAATTWARFALKMPAPSAIYTLAQIRDSTTATLLAVRVNTNGTLTIRDGATNRDTTTYAFDNSEYVQVAFGISGGQVRLRLYDLEGNLLETEISGTYTGTTIPYDLAWGVITSPTSSPYVVDFDEVGYNTHREITPLALYSGAASFSAETTLTAVGTVITNSTPISGSDTTSISSTETAYVGPDENTEDFEGGTNNAAVSDTNTNFELVSGTGAFTFDSVNALHGGLAGEIDASSASVRGKFRTLGRRNKLYFSGYFKFAGFTENSKIVELETLEVDSNGVCNLWLKTTGKIEVRDGLDATGTLTTTTLSADTWYRLDLRYDLELEEIELRIYTGANLEGTGTSYTETLTIAKAELTNTHIERVMVGRALTNSSLMYIDSLAYSDQDWPAPRGVAATPISDSDTTQIGSSETADVVSTELVEKSASDSTELFLDESIALSAGAEPGPFEEEETFENGTVGSTVTTGTIFDSAITGGSSTCTVESNDALHGTKSAEFNAVSASASGRINFPSLQSLVYVRAYMKFSSFGSGTNTSVITFYDTTSTLVVRASVQIMAATPTNGIRIRNGTTEVDVSTTSFSDDTWYRLEYMIDDVNNTQELRIWGGSTIESPDTADCIEILTGAYTQATSTTGRVSIGPIATPGETVLTTVDSVAWGNTDWIGPYATGDGTVQIIASDATLITGTDDSSLNAGVVTHSGVASFSAESSLTTIGKRKAVASASFSAQSSLTANGSRRARGVASFSAQSSLTASATRTTFGVAIFSSESSMTTNGTRTVRGYATFSAESSLTVVGSRTASAAVTLSAQSSLTASGTKRFNGTATLSAQSSLTVNGTRKAVASATLSAQSSLTANGTRRVYGIAIFSSQSSMTTNGTKTVRGYATFSSETILTASATRTAFASATMSAESSLTASATRMTFGVIALSAQSSMIASAAGSVLGSASLSAESSLTASATRKTFGVATFSSVSSMTTNGTKTVRGYATFSAESSLTSSGIRRAVASATLSAESSLTASGTKRFNGIVTFSAESSLTAVGLRKAVASASLSAESSLLSNGTRRVLGAAVFSSVSSMTTNGTKTVRGYATFSAESSLTAIGSRKAVASASLSAESSLTVVGTKRILGSVVLSAQSSLTVVGSRRATGVIVLSAESSFTASATRTVFGVASFSSQSSMTTDGSNAVRGYVTFSAESSMTVDGTRTAVASVTLSAQSSLTSNGTRGVLAAISMSADSSLVASGTRRATGVVTLSSESSLTASATRIVYGSASFSSESNLSTSGVNTVRGYCVFSAESSLTANGTRKAVSSASLSAESSLTANATRGVRSTVTLSSQTVLTANGTRKTFASTSLSAESSLTANGIRKTFGSAIFSSQSSMTTDGTKKVRGYCTLSSESSLVVVGQRTAVSSASLSGQSSLTATATLTTIAVNLGTFGIPM